MSFIKANMNHGEYQWYYHETPINIRLFNTGICDTCGAVTMEANSIGGLVSEINKWESLGAKEWKGDNPVWLPEIQPIDDERGCYYGCTNCDGDKPTENSPVMTDEEYFSEDHISEMYEEDYNYIDPEWTEDTLMDEIDMLALEESMDEADAADYRYSDYDDMDYYEDDFVDYPPEYDDLSNPER